MENTRNDMAVMLFPHWTIAQHRKAWLKQFKRKAIPIGAIFVTPGGQEFTFIGYKLWGAKPKAKGDKKRQVSFIFESHCVLCGSPYSFRVPSYFTGVIRTCPEHRGSYRKPRRARPQRPKRVFTIADAIARTFAELALLGPSATHDAVVLHCEQLVPDTGQRDTRRQRVTRALLRMADSGKLPAGVVMTDDAFLFN